MGRVKKAINVFGVMLFCVLFMGQINALAITSADGNWEYTLFNAYEEEIRQYVQILGYYGEETTVTIPTRLDNYEVKDVLFTQSPDDANTSSIKKLIVPEGITSITMGEEFDDSMEIETIQLSSTLEHINLDNCKQLKEIMWPVRFPLTRMTSISIVQCDNIENLTLPDGLYGFPMGLSGAFFGCTHLRKVTINGCVGMCQYDMFCGCTELEEVYIDRVNSNNDDFDVIVLSFTNLGKLKKVELPKELVYIPPFTNSPNLISVYVPESIKSIKNAFRYCNNLSDIYYAGSECQWKGIDITSDTSIGDKLGQATIHYAKGSEHIPSDWIITKSASCKEDGLQEKHCESCGEVLETQVIPKTGSHVFSNSWVTTKAATCKEAGTKERICSICGEKETQAIAKLTTHAYGSWSVTKEPTCKDAGKLERICSICNQKEELSISKLSVHSYGDWSVTKAATCKETGSEERTCSVCNKKETRVLPKLNTHTWNKWIVSKAASLSTEGELERSCSVCGIKENASFGKLTAKLRVGKTSVKIEKTKSVNLAVSFTEGDTLKVVSSNTSVATAQYIDELLVITAGKIAGTANITVSTGTGKVAVVTVTVPKVKTKKITCKAVSVKKGKKVTLKPKVTPTYSDDKVAYKSANKKIATVTAKGVVKGIKPGKTTITIKSGKKSVKVKVTVEK